jgi:hypothetical protein
MRKTLWISDLYRHFNHTISHCSFCRVSSIDPLSDLASTVERRTQNGFLAAFLGATPALYASKVSGSISVCQFANFTKFSSFLV